MRHALQVGHDRRTADILAERECERRADLVVGLRFDDFAEGDDLALFVRNFEAHDRLAGNHLDHANADRRQSASQIFGERADLACLHAWSRTHLETRNHGPGQHGHDLDLDAEIFELELDEPRHRLECLGRVRDLARRWIVEQLQRWQLAGLRREERYLPLLVDALALLRLRRRCLDTRLGACCRFLGLDLEVFLASGLALFTLGDVTLLNATRTEPIDGTPKTGAETVDHDEPGDTESQRDAGHRHSERE